MQRMSWAVLLAALLLAPGTARASVTSDFVAYDFWGLFVSSRDADGQALGHGAVVLHLRHDGPIIRDGFHALHSCISMEPGFSCDLPHWVAPSGAAEGVPDHPFPVSVLGLTLHDSATGAVWMQHYVFAAGAFQSNGAHETLPPPTMRMMRAAVAQDSGWYGLLQVSGLVAPPPPALSMVAAPAGLLPLALLALGLVRLRRSVRP